MNENAVPEGEQRLIEPPDAKAFFEVVDAMRDAIEARAITAPILARVRKAADAVMVTPDTPESGTSLGAPPSNESVRCTCEWAHPVGGEVSGRWPAELDPQCLVHGAPNDFARDDSPAPSSGSSEMLSREQHRAKLNSHENEILVETRLRIAHEIEAHDDAQRTDIAALRTALAESQRENERLREERDRASERKRLVWETLHAHGFRGLDIPDEVKGAVFSLLVISDRQLTDSEKAYASTIARRALATTRDAGETK